MPREEHLTRQVEWKNKLEKYGCYVALEKTYNIKGAQVIVDVYVKTEEKTFLIEIGDITDTRKEALMQYYAKEHPNIKFIHEGYDDNDMIPEVLKSIDAYRKSPEYQQLLEERKQEEKQISEEEKILTQQKLKDKKIQRRNRYIIYTLLGGWLIPPCILLAVADEYATRSIIWDKLIDLFWIWLFSGAAIIVLIIIIEIIIYTFTDKELDELKRKNEIWDKEQRIRDFRQEEQERKERENRNEEVTEEEEYVEEDYDEDEDVDLQQTYLDEEDEEK